MNRAERVTRDLAIAEGARKFISEAARAVRAEADSMLDEAGALLGAKSMDVRLFGEKVGKLSASVSKPQVYVEDEAAYQDWLRERYVLGDERVTAFYEAPLVEKGAQALTDGAGGYMVFDAETGELIEGLAYRPGGRATGTRLLGCEPEDVMRCLRRENMTLGDAIGLLCDATGLLGDATGLLGDATGLLGDGDAGVR